MDNYGGIKKECDFSSLQNLAKNLETILFDQKIQNKIVFKIKVHPLICATSAKVDHCLSQLLPVCISYIFLVYSVCISYIKYR